MTDKKRVIALISGRGSNLQALLEAQSDSACSYQIAGVLSDCDAPGLNLARQRQIHCKYFPRTDFASRQQQRSAIFDEIRLLSPDLVVLAGFMMIIPEQYTRELHGKLVNIHPSLLPNFPGLDTHARAITAGATQHGCSTHFVDHGVDTGPLIAQAICPVQKDDSATTLAARVLQLEHQLFPWTVSKIAAGDISLTAAGADFSTSARADALALGFKLPS